MKIYHYSVSVVVFIWFSQVNFATNTMIFGNQDLDLFCLGEHFTDSLPHA